MLKRTSLTLSPGIRGWCDGSLGSKEHILAALQFEADLIKFSAGDEKIAVKYRRSKLERYFVSGHNEHRVFRAALREESKRMTSFILFRENHVVTLEIEVHDIANKVIFRLVVGFDHRGKVSTID
jgi:hypothetical protein